MAVKVPVTLSPVDTKKVDAAIARIQSQAKGVNFGEGARSLEKLSRPLGKISGQATEFQKSLEASNARVLAFGASVAVINKLSDAFGALVSNTIKVEATFAKINTILGGTEQQLRQFGNGIFDVARKTATSFDEVAEGALELARQGLSVEESLSRVETALKLVRVAGIDSQEAVAGLTAAIKGFENSGITVAEIADKLAEVDTKFAVSTEDLINGLERASASARVAGVSFDELLGLITTVQERTQRGGAVIGNAFKTIFARLGRQDTLIALQELGISVLDTEGNVRSAIPLFNELAVELDKLGLKSVEAGEVIQRVAGVRQRDILISLVEDLTSGQSQFAKSLQVSAGAAGALDQKNDQLNQTLEALINNTLTSGQQLASIFGDLGFADAAKTILTTFNSVIGSLKDLLQGEGIGSDFARGLVRGIGGVLTGPGLALVTAIFIKLFVDLAKFGATSLKQILGINRAAEQQKLLQQSVLQTLLQNENIQREILALEGNKVAQEQLLLRIYNQQAAALSRVQKAAATVTPGLFGSGFRGGERGVTRRGAGGYIAAEARDISRGVGGATSGSKVVSIPNFAFGGGKRGTMVANTSEYYVPNYKGGGDAIFNRDMVRSSGLPSGARKINASNGFIPNFARVPSLERLRGIAKGTGPRAAAAKTELAKREKAKSKQKLIFSDRFAMIVPQVIGPKRFVQGTRAGKKVGFNMVGFEPGVGSRVRNDEQLDDSVRKYALGLANSEAKKLGGPPKPDKVLKLANTGAISALSGTIFETAVSSLLNSNDFDARSEIAAFDFSGSRANEKLKNLFPQLGNATEIEAKIRLSKANRESMFDKILKATGNAAFGYIPNYAGGALDKAIAREQSAGVPINQIRINQSGKLRNAQNPGGLAVTNTRDEPTGRIPNFQSGGTGGIERFNSAILIASTSLFALSSAFGNAEGTIGKFISGLSLGLSVLGSLSLLKGPLDGLSARLTTFGSGLTKNAEFLGKYGTTFQTTVPTTTGKLIGSFGKMLPIIGNIIAVGSFLIPLASQFGLFESETKRTTKALEGFKNGLMDATDVEKKAAVEKAELEVKAAEARLAAAEKAAEGAVPMSGVGIGGIGFAPTPILDDERQAERNLSLARDRLNIAREAFGQTPTARREQFIAAEGGEQNVISRERAGIGVRGAFGRRGAGIETAASTAILEKRLALLNAVTEEQKTALNFEIKSLELQKDIDNLRNQGLQKLAEEAVKTGKVELVNKDKLISVLETVDANTDSLKLQEELARKLGIEGAEAEKLLNIAIENAEALKKEQSIRKNLLADEKTLAEATSQRADALEKITQKFNAQERSLIKQTELAQILRESQAAALERELKAGPVSPKRRREIEFQQKELQLAGELANAEKAAADTKREAQEAQQRFLETESNEDADALLRADLQAELAQERLTTLKETVKEQTKLNEKLRDQTGFGRAFDQIDQRVLNFGDEFAERIPLQFADTLGVAFQDAVSGAKDLEDILNNAGRSFLGFISQALTQQAANQLVSGFGTAFGGLFGNRGGLVGNKKIQAFNAGGMVSPRDTVPAMLTPGEFVMSKPAVDRYGGEFLSRLNQGQVNQTQSTETNGGVSNSINLTFNVSQGQNENNENNFKREGDFNSENTLVRRLRQSVVQIIAEESRPGGALYG